MKEGRIVQATDIKEVIRRNAENNASWEWNEEYVVVNNLATLFKNELVDPILLTNRTQMPDPLIGFDDARNKEILAYYNTVPNAFGIPDEIILNTAHYKTNEAGRKEWIWGRWSQCETIVHEEAHLLLNHIAKIEGKKIPAHGVRFCELLEGWGIHPTPVVGSHYQVAEADSPFGRIMNGLGIPRPKGVPRVEGKRDWFRPTKEKGKSTLHKWECPNCGLALRVGIKGDIDSTHDACGTKYIRSEKGVIYEGGGKK